MAPGRSLLICVCLGTFLLMTTEGHIARENKATFWEKAKNFLGWTTPPPPPPSTKASDAAFAKRATDRSNFYDEMAMLGAYQDFYGAMEENNKELKK